MSRSNSALIDSVWPVNTGTRTQVPATRSSGRPRSLRDSLRSFCSSSVSSDPSSTIAPATGSTLNAIGATYGPVSSTLSVEPSWTSSWPAPMFPVSWVLSASTPARPEPETAWYVATTSRVSPAASCNALSAGIAAIVVQLGLAMIPLGGFCACSGLTSDTTSGTSGSLRQALELSTTTAPAAANLGACSLDIVPPAENRATSIPLSSSSVAAAVSSTTTSSPRNGSV